jgi:hypothetical protein
MMTDEVERMSFGAKRLGREKEVAHHVSHRRPEHRARLFVSSRLLLHLVESRQLHSGALSRLPAMRW